MKKLILISSLLMSFNAYSQTPAAKPSKEETIKWISDKIVLYGRRQDKSSNSGVLRYDTTTVTSSAQGIVGASMSQIVIASVTNTNSGQFYTSLYTNTKLELTDIISVDTTNSLIIIGTDGSLISVDSTWVNEDQHRDHVTYFKDKFNLYFNWDNTEHDFFRRLFSAFQILVQYNKSNKSKETF